MPVRQPPPLMQPAIGARLRDPIQTPDIGGAQLHTVRHLGLPPGVVRTGAGRGIEQLAVHPRGDHLAGVLILEPHQTAQPAPVAQALPLGGGHLLQRLGLPERAHVRAPRAPTRPTVLQPTENETNSIAPPHIRNHRRCRGGMDERGKKGGPASGADQAASTEASAPSCMARFADTWNRRISRCSSAASRSRLWLAAVDCSTMAAFCWVVWSI